MRLCYLLRRNFHLEVRKREKQILNSNVRRTADVILSRAHINKYMILNKIRSLTSIFPKNYVYVVHRVLILNRGSMPRKRTGRKWPKTGRKIFPTRMGNVTAWRPQRLRAHWLMSLVGGGVGGVVGDWERSMYSAFPGNCSVSYLFFCLWEESVSGA